MDQCVLPTEIIFYIFDFCDTRTKLHFKNTCSDMSNSFVNLSWPKKYFHEEKTKKFRFYANNKHIKTIESQSIKIASEKFFKNNKRKAEYVNIQIEAYCTTNNDKYNIIYNNSDINIVRVPQKNEMYTYKYFYNNNFMGCVKGRSPIAAAKKAFTAINKREHPNQITEANIIIKKNWTHQLYGYHIKKVPYNWDHHFDFGRQFPFVKTICFKSYYQAQRIDNDQIKEIINKEIKKGIKLDIIRKRN
jgi:hypothetical protein